MPYGEYANEKDDGEERSDIRPVGPRGNPVIPLTECRILFDLEPQTIVSINSPLTLCESQGSHHETIVNPSDLVPAG